MVCKEEVLLWFKDLDSFKRIDVLYELLNMCLPFELRFLGSCIEELGKHTYQELRGSGLTANDEEKLKKDTSFNQGIMDESVRHRVLLYLSLLSSRNYKVANWMYIKLLRTDYIEEYLVKGGKDDTSLSEFLLLFTMALHHPAFTFDQKQFFGRILATLITIRENRLAAKHNALGYPPGFGYPTQKMPSESPTVPVKTTAMSSGDPPSTFHQQVPGLPHLPPPPHIDFFATMLSRPGFPYGAPEVPPFPAPTISPLVSQEVSPSHSRSTSPHRTQMGIRPLPLQALQPPPTQQLTQPPPICPLPNPPSTMNGPPLPADHIGTGTGPPPQIPIEPLSQPSLPVFNNLEIKLTDEERAAKLAAEEKHLRDILWPQPGPVNPEVKPNGIRFPTFVGKPRPFLMEQLQAMNLEGENALHHSNPSSNSSSPQETPPGTPASTPATTPHGPGRGENKARPNGMPTFGASPGPPIQEAGTTPPPPPAFSNSSVPYSYPQPFPSLPPNRSMFPFNPAFRPTFTAQYPYQTDSFPTYTFPYVHVMYSSPFPARNLPGCYNCGSPSHHGNDCTCQNIEEITQKKNYQLDYTPPLPDPDK